MKVAKRFRWEGAHRLPWHLGGCQNIHGHSYYMWVELKGEEDERGLLIDFKDIKQIIDPLVASWDHAILIAATDNELLNVIKQIDSKHFILPYDTTSENLCLYVIEYLRTNALDLLQAHNIASINVKVQETETCFAEYEVAINQLEMASKNKKAAAQLYS
jgi:6-pyruvoyltetrahydropterin/6-carboxytetrahydropterin synthase